MKKVDRLACINHPSIISVKDGLCVKCYNKRAYSRMSIEKKEYWKKKGKEWRIKNRERFKERGKVYWCKIKYKITPLEYDEMRARQGGKCAICKEPHTLALDHNHKTGKLREFLCVRCNLAIGYIRDSIEIAKNIKIYLEKHD